MTPTPAELALWRALNVEPEEQSDYWPGWSVRQIQFSFLHPADRLAYFEGKVREKLPGYDLCITCESGAWIAHWYGRDRDEHYADQQPTEHLARFHAAARAIHALGMITEQQLKEIEGHG